MLKNDRKGYRFAGILALVFLLMPSFAVQAELVTRIAVISFQALPATEGHTVSCPLCGAGSSSGKIMEGAEKIVEDVFMDRLNKARDIELIPSEKVQRAYGKTSSGKSPETSAENFKKVGRELGADFLVIGYVYRYTERVGYKYSSEHPASVVFEIHLIKTADGSSIWRGFFDKTQTSLMENLFEIFSFFKGGAIWVDARQLTELGMDEVFETFPTF